MHPSCKASRCVTLSRWPRFTAEQGAIREHRRTHGMIRSHLGLSIHLITSRLTEIKERNPSWRHSPNAFMHAGLCPRPPFDSAPPHGLGTALAFLVVSLQPATPPRGSTQHHHARWSLVKRNATHGTRRTRRPSHAKLPPRCRPICGDLTLTLPGPSTKIRQDSTVPAQQARHPLRSHSRRGWIPVSAVCHPQMLRFPHIRTISGALPTRHDRYLRSGP